MEKPSTEASKELIEFAKKERMKGWIVSVVFGLVLPVAIVLCVVLSPIVFRSH